MRSFVLTAVAWIARHMSTSGSRGSQVIERGRGRPTSKISCATPPLVCISTVSAHADSLTAESSWPRIQRVDNALLRCRCNEVRRPFSVRSIGALASLKAEFGAVPRTITASLRVTTMQTRWWTGFLAIFKAHAFRLLKPGSGSMLAA